MGNQQVIKLRRATLGDNLSIKRALPSREKRLIGAWCFLDHLGPVEVNGGVDGIHVNPHPHIGLQTFTWMLSGEIEHQDSLGFEQTIRENQINLMTSGRGIVHTEDTPEGSNMPLHCIQLWIALPKEKKDCEPAFVHYPSIPQFTHEGLKMSLLVGELLGYQSPVACFSPLVAVDIKADEPQTFTLPLNPSFEYGILVINGEVTIAETVYDPDLFCYQAAGETSISLETSKNGHILVIGGEPLHEDFIIWWNFVARTQEEIEAALAAWENDDPIFPDMLNYPGARMKAPEIRGRLRASR